MDRHFKVFALGGLAIAIILLAGCTRKFTLIPQMKSYDFTVAEKFGKIGYVSANDTRNELDKKGKSPSGCILSGDRGITVLGDKNYESGLLLEFDKHMKKALIESGLFTQIVAGTSSEADYIFRSELEQFHVVLDETKAKDTQACIGGCVGAVIASTVDVDATTDMRITGVLLEGEEEIWRKSLLKHVLKVDDYGSTRTNAENAMGEALGEACKELVTELAIFLASK